MPKKPIKRPRKKKLISVKDLAESTENKPDIVHPRKKRIRGPNTQMGLLEFWADLFVWNEVVPASKKRTNAGLAEIVLKEFAKTHPALKVRLYENKKYGVNYYRQLYNNGRCSTGIKPPYVSFRYNAQGVACDYRSGTIPLSTVEKKKYQARYGLGLAAYVKSSKAKLPTELEDTSST